MRGYIKESAVTYRDELTLVDAVRHINKNGIGYVAFINDAGNLFGIITDADLRKAVLTSKTDLSEIINRKPKVASEGDSHQKIITLLKKTRRRHMPIIGPCGKYRGVFCLDDYDFNTKQNTVVIMAGGLGSRMGDLTKDTPKPMLEVGKKPVLEHIIDYFAGQGFIDFILCVNYKKQVIKDYFKDGYDKGLKIEYVEETKRLGTGGALGLIDRALELPIIVCNGDVLTNVDFDSLLAFHDDQAAEATMCVREHKSYIQYGVINADEQGSILKLEEKPEITSLINAGVYVLNPKTLVNIRKDEWLDLPDHFEYLISKNATVKCFKLEKYWIDIGLKEQFDKANSDYDQMIGHEKYDNK